MDKNYSILRLIKTSLWGAEAGEVTQEDYEEMRFHTIQALPASVLSALKMPEPLRHRWKKDILQQISYSVNYRYVQDNLPVQVPYVVLKGSSAAQYYPNPEYRIMGDIDIMTRREDFSTAYRQLVDNNFLVQKETEREICFSKNGVIIELHRFFASLNQPSQSQYLDELIIDNINPAHVLPDMVNGLVILEHISQHLEHGLGLRQIVDWMMFVDKCLMDNDKWYIFQDMAQRIGLKNLAIISTRMCEIYLGLPEHEWCSGANISVCDQFMDYVISCGNFGNKWGNEKDVGQTVFSYIRNPIAAYKWFQERGLINWKATKRFPFLRPFAWIYQACRYAKRGIIQEGSTTAIKDEFVLAQKRVRLFETLGVKQRSKGLVVYRNGKYVKK